MLFVFYVLHTKLLDLPIFLTQISQALRKLLLNSQQLLLFHPLPIPIPVPMPLHRNRTPVHTLRFRKYMFSPFILHPRVSELPFVIGVVGVGLVLFEDLLVLLFYF